MAGSTCTPLVCTPDIPADVPSRKRLVSSWGIADVRDCALAVSLLAQQHGLVDAARAAIRGRSSGGFTVLAALCAHPDAFAAGASHFGISDLQKLDEFTHKFESRYCETLLGGTFAAVPDVYRQRSPVNNAGRIKAPLLVRARVCRVFWAGLIGLWAGRFCRARSTRWCRLHRLNTL